MHYVVLQSAVITVSFRQSLAKRRFQYADDGTRRKAAERLHRAERLCVRDPELLSGAGAKRRPPSRS